MNFAFGLLELAGFGGGGGLDKIFGGRKKQFSRCGGASTPAYSSKKPAHADDETVVMDGHPAPGPQHSIDRG
jgi:hypothetical protein